MKITQHGERQIFDRTRMKLYEVNDVISTNQFVSIGYSEGKEFLLFYSTKDRECKIAVTAEKRKVLVTVLETYFILPHTVDKVTSSLENRAKEKFFQHKRPDFKGLPTV